MKKTIILFFCISFLFSCDSDRKILINGVTYVDLNVRANPDPSFDGNIIDKLVPGDIVQIVSFNDKVGRNGVYWCEIKLDRPANYDGKELNYAWVAYSVKDLPFVVDNDSWVKIKRMYEMEHEQEVNEILLGSKTWVTQAIYDYVYYDNLKDIKYYYNENRDNQLHQRENPNSRYELEQPSHSVDYTTKDTYPKYCRIRITSSSVNRDEEALYAVSFNQSPRNIHFFRQDKRTNRGSFVKEFQFGNSFDSSIKSIQRKSKSSRIYYADYYGYKTKLNLNYDAIRIRPHNSRKRYIVYNPVNYTSDNMNEAYFSVVEEY